MTPAKLSLQELANIVGDEDLDFCVRFQVKSESIEDPVVADLWRVAKCALDQILSVLPESDEIWDDMDDEDDFYDMDEEDDDDEDLDDEDDD